MREHLATSEQKRSDAEHQAEQRGRELSDSQFKLIQATDLAAVKTRAFDLAGAEIAALEDRLERAIRMEETSRKANTLALVDIKTWKLKSEQLSKNLSAANTRINDLETRLVNSSEDARLARAELSALRTSLVQRPLQTIWLNRQTAN